jgi:hypothetical protein
MRSADELAVLSKACRLRIREGEDEELWMPVPDEFIAEAARLAEAGLLYQEWCRECADLHWRISDAGMAEIIPIIALWN